MLISLFYIGFTLLMLSSILTHFVFTPINGDEYTITVNFIDDAETPHRITGTWTGTLTPYSYTASVSGLLEQSMKPVK